MRGAALGILPFRYYDPHPKGDTDWWAVWVGRHALEKISRAPKGWLRWVRNPPESARAKASLM